MGSGGSKGGTSTSSQTSGGNSTTSPPQWVLDQYSKVLGMANKAADKPFQNYGGEFVAPVNPTQQGGIDTITGAAGSWAPYTAAAGATLGSGLGAAGSAVGQGQYYGTGLGQAAIGQTNQTAQGSQAYNNAAGDLYGAGYTGAQPFNAGAAGLALAGTGAVNPTALTGDAIRQYESPYNADVVNATVAQMQNQFGQQRRDLTGNQILSGSFGSDRGGVGQGVLANQQSLALGQTVSGLYNQNYAQALQAAQQQQGVGLGAAQGNRAALQQGVGQLLGVGNQIYGQGTGTGQAVQGLGNQVYNQGLGVANQYLNTGNTLFGQGNTAAGTYANLGIGGANAFSGLGTANLTNTLSQGQSQIGAGTVAQQTKTAEDQARYNQFLQEQGYDFQTAQFLAGISEGVGALSGSSTTSSGSSNASSYTPQPFFSDERLKEDIHVIGHTNDGQEIIRFRYRGQPHTQLGLRAQDVLKHHPDAVGKDSGYLTVDYDAATRDAMRPTRADGGLVPRNSYDNGSYAAGGAPDISNLVALHQNMYPSRLNGIGIGEGPRGMKLRQRSGATLQGPKVDLHEAKLPTPASDTSLGAAIGALNKGAETGKNVVGGTKAAAEALVGTAGTGTYGTMGYEPPTGGLVGKGGEFGGGWIQKQFEPSRPGGIVPWQPPLPGAPATPPPAWVAPEAAGGRVGRAPGGGLPYDTKADYVPENTAPSLTTLLAEQKGLSRDVIEPPSPAPGKPGGGGMGTMIDPGGMLNIGMSMFHSGGHVEGLRPRRENGGLAYLPGAPRPNDIPERSTFEQMLDPMEMSQKISGGSGGGGGGGGAGAASGAGGAGGAAETGGAAEAAGGLEELAPLALMVLKRGGRANGLRPGFNTGGNPDETVSGEPPIAGPPVIAVPPLPGPRDPVVIVDPLPPVEEPRREPKPTHKAPEPPLITPPPPPLPTVPEPRPTPQGLQPKPGTVPAPTTSANGVAPATTPAVPAPSAAPSPVTPEAREKMLQQAEHAIATIEVGSSDPDHGWNIVGPPTRYPDGRVDRPYGRFGVMGANVPAWTKQYYGRELTPQQYLENRDAQRAVFRGQYGNYADQYGDPSEAAGAWFAGPGGRNGTASDNLGTSVPAYRKRFMSLYDGSPYPGARGVGGTGVGGGASAGSADPAPVGLQPGATPLPDPLAGRDLYTGKPNRTHKEGFFDENGWLDRNQREVVSGLTFLGNMLGSDRRTLLGSVGQGLAAAAPGYLESGFTERGLNQRQVGLVQAQQGLGQAEQRIGLQQQQVDVSTIGQQLQILNQLQTAQSNRMSTPGVGPDPVMGAQIEELQKRIGAAALRLDPRSRNEVEIALRAAQNLRGGTSPTSPAPAAPGPIAPTVAAPATGGVPPMGPGPSGRSPAPAPVPPGAGAAPPVTGGAVAGPPPAVPSVAPPAPTAPPVALGPTVTTAPGAALAGWGHVPPQYNPYAMKAQAAEIRKTNPLDDSQARRLEDRAQQILDKANIDGFVSVPVTPDNPSGRIALPGAMEAKRSTQFQTANTEWSQREAAADTQRRVARQSLDVVHEALQQFETNPAAGMTTRFQEALRTIGLDPGNFTRMNAEAVQKINKAAAALMLNMPNASTDVARAAAEVANIDPSKNPEANKSILAQAYSELDAANHRFAHINPVLETDPGRDRSELERKWSEANPQDRFKAEAYKNLAVLGANGPKVVSHNGAPQLDLSEAKPDHVYILKPGVARLAGHNVTVPTKFRYVVRDGQKGFVGVP